MTNKEKTFQALDSSFQMEGNKINIGYLIETIELNIMNTRKIYDLLKNKRTKTHSIIWIAFEYTTNECLKNEFYPSKYECTSEQLKAYLKSDGYNYLTCFVELIKDIDEQRKEL